MARFQSLGQDPHLLDVFERFPKGVSHLMHLHDVILRGPSEFTVGEREMMAAFVSGVNQCDFCSGTHAAVAELFGIPENQVQCLLEDPESAGLEDKWLPLLDYLKKLTLTPARMSDLDAEKVFAAGWSEEAVFDAILICGLFNFSNRVVEGSGVRVNAEHVEVSRSRHGQMFHKPNPYSEAGRDIGIID